PLALMSWGLLLPYLLSLALMPIAITSVVHLIGLAPPGRQRLSRPATLVLLASGCGAVALAHPQGVFGGLVLGVPILLWATLVRARSVPGHRGADRGRDGRLGDAVDPGPPRTGVSGLGTQRLAAGGHRPDRIFVPQRLSHLRAHGRGRGAHPARRAAVDPIALVA